MNHLQSSGETQLEIPHCDLEQLKTNRRKRDANRRRVLLLLSCIPLSRGYRSAD